MWAGRVWGSGLYNILTRKRCTGGKCSGYMYITCKAAGVSDTCAYKAGGNIGFGNSGKYNVGNNNAGSGNIGNNNGGDSNVGDFHPVGSDGNV
jgi:hypothetical protein